MVVGAKICDLTDGFLWFVCGLYVGILTSPLTGMWSLLTCECGYSVCHSRYPHSLTCWVRISVL